MRRQRRYERHTARRCPKRAPCHTSVGNPSGRCSHFQTAYPPRVRPPLPHTKGDERRHTSVRPFPPASRTVRTRRQQASPAADRKGCNRLAERTRPIATKSRERLHHKTVRETPQVGRAAKKEEQEGKEQCEKVQNREKDRLKKVRVGRKIRWEKDRDGSKTEAGQRPGQKNDRWKIYRNERASSAAPHLFPGIHMPKPGNGRQSVYSAEPKIVRTTMPVAPWWRVV